MKWYEQFAGKAQRKKVITRGSFTFAFPSDKWMQITCQLLAAKEIKSSQTHTVVLDISIRLDMLSCYTKMPNQCHKQNENI